LCEKVVSDRPIRMSAIKPSATLTPQPTSARSLPILTTGLTIGLFTLIAAVSFGALIFSGELANHLSTGIGLALFGSVMVLGLSSLLSSYPGTIAGPHHTTAAILGLTVSTIIGSIAAVADERQILLTAVGTILLKLSDHRNFLFCDRLV
jgi:SulP family sulfate permease